MPNVLIGAGGTGTAFGIASRLRSSYGSDLKIIVTDIFDEHLVTTSVLADRFYKAPYANDPKFETFIVDILEAEKITTYIPILNEEIILAAKLRAAEEYKHIDFWSSSLHAACTDKLFADNWLRTIGVRTPFRFGDQSQKTPNQFFVKPKTGSSSRGVKQLTAHQVIALSQTERDSFLIQEVCKGPEVTVDSFFDETTKTGFAYCRERIEVKAGVCTKARLFYDPELEDFAFRIGIALSQRQTICFQVMRNGDGWVLTDLNLRTGAGTAMTCAAGFDVLSAAFVCRNGGDYSRYLRKLKLGEEYYVTRQYAEFVMHCTQ